MRHRVFTAAFLLATAATTATVLTSGAAAQGSDLDDPRIAHIAVTANAIDVEMGELATERAADERVVTFAETMISDHTAVNEQAGALAARLGVTPVDNEISRSLRAGADEARAELVGLSGSAFDRAYMAREVAYHQAVLAALDDALIPNTTNDELRALLEQARAAVAAHLEHATMLRGALGGGA